MQARVVVLSNNTHLAFVRSLVEQNCLIITAAEALKILDPDTVGHCSLCLVEGRVPSHTARHLQTCGVTRILGTKGDRRLIPGWTHGSWVASHTQLGGVTTEKVSGVCLLLGSTPPTEVDGPEGVGRDASTVLSVQAPAIRYCAAPSQSTVLPLGCEQLGTRDSPCFHGGGLLLEGCDRKTVVLTPDMFAPKGKWAKRTLTIEEVLISKDCGRVAVQFLFSLSQRNQAHQSRVPNARDEIRRFGTKSVMKNERV
jgi:hypothetical protein